ncbi:unnamed protein product [Coffea canephora]|uniref:Uncharacterized protein n=1 Tax=Coffea canephora TaxID=49390 RepID=A0A068U518_COFCA|nr:unnamed protein product [Coffea canephora]
MLPWIQSTRFFLQHEFSVKDSFSPTHLREIDYLNQMKLLLCK